MLFEAGTARILEYSRHQVEDRKFRAQSLAGVLLQVAAHLEVMGVEWTGRHSKRSRIERYPLDSRLELFHSRPQFSRARHAQALVVDHLVFGMRYLDFFGSAQ